MYSPKRATRSPVVQLGRPTISYDGSIVRPVPRPSSTRPFETWSAVTAWLARIAGLRSGICDTYVASRSVEVRAATADSDVHASSQGLGGLAQSQKCSGNPPT